MNRPLAAVAALAALALLGGCGGGSRPLALVGKGAVTVDDYQWAAPGAADQYPVLPDSAKSLFIEDLIRHQLLMLEADNRGMFEDSLVINFRRLKEEELLVQSLGQELAPAGIPVSKKARVARSTAELLGKKSIAPKPIVPPASAANPTKTRCAWRASASR